MRNETSIVFGIIFLVIGIVSFAIGTGEAYGVHWGWGLLGGGTILLGLVLVIFNIARRE